MKKIYTLLVALCVTTISASAVTKTVKYKVKSGETLYSIAHKNHTTIAVVRKLNAFKKGEILKYGRILKVPSNKKYTSKNKKKNKIKFVKTKFKTHKSKKITSIAKKKLGKRYVWGASGKHNTYDCSSFVKYVYRQQGINIPRTSLNQSKYGKYISRRNLKEGDLIFFDTSKRRKGYVNHVGMYIGNGKFIHASSAKKKVIISSLKRFYSKRYKGARRPV